MGEPGPGVARARAVTELAERRFDLLVIGGGIIGTWLRVEREELATLLEERVERQLAPAGGEPGRSSV